MSPVGKIRGKKDNPTLEHTSQDSKMCYKLAFANACYDKGSPTIFRKGQ